MVGYHGLVADHGGIHHGLAKTDEAEEEIHHGTTQNKQWLNQYEWLNTSMDTLIAH